MLGVSSPAPRGERKTREKKGAPGRSQGVWGAPAAFFARGGGGVLAGWSVLKGYYGILLVVVLHELKEVLHSTAAEKSGHDAYPNSRALREPSFEKQDGGPVQWYNAPPQTVRTRPPAAVPSKTLSPTRRTKMIFMLPQEAPMMVLVERMSCRFRKEVKAKGRTRNLFRFETTRENTPCCRSVLQGRPPRLSHSPY